MFGLASVDDFHLEGVSQDEGKALWSAEIGEAIPGEEAFHGHDQPLPIGSNGLEEGVWSGFHISVQQEFTSWLKIQTYMLRACRSIPQ
jgi:hypothetical protein